MKKLKLLKSCAGFKGYLRKHGETGDRAGEGYFIFNNYYWYNFSAEF